MRDFFNAKTTLALGLANKVPGNQVVSLMVVGPSPEKIPLNPLHSICKLNRSPKKTKGIGREVLENRVDQGEFASLTEGSPFPTYKFPFEIIYDAIPKGIRRFSSKRYPKISHRQGPSATSQDARNFPLPLQRCIEEEN